MPSPAPRFVTLLGSLVVVAAAALGVAGCKQGEGEQCQVNADCADGLICRENGKVCATGADTPVLDAGPDAPWIDAQGPDAEGAPDAAAPDATAPDATAPDAAAPDATP